jgi:hypothetical protein
MGQVIAIVVGAVVFLAAFATVLDWLGFVPNGPRIVSRIKARVSASRRERDEIRRRQAAMAEQMQALEARIADLERLVGRWPTAGMVWDRSPEAQRIKQAARDRDKKPTVPPN